MRWVLLVVLVTALDALGDAGVRLTATTLVEATPVASTQLTDDSDGCLSSSSGRPRARSSTASTSFA